MTDDDLVEIVRGFKSGILGNNSSHGACLMICFPLASLLRVFDVACEVVESDHSVNPESRWHSHFWIKLEDGRVLDPTFDQFGDTTSIYLGPPTKFHRRLHSR
jgi:hypothetical protein